MSPGLDGGVVFSARAMPWLSAAGVIVASPATPSLASVVPTTGAGLAASMLPRRMKVSSLRLPKTAGSYIRSYGPIQNSDCAASTCRSLVLYVTHPVFSNL